MKVESIKTFTGANIYRRQPVTLMRVDLEELKGKKSIEIGDFNRRLLELLPELKEHFCDAGKPGGFVEKLNRGTGFNHVIEHAAMELLAKAGFDVRDKKICNDDEKDDSLAVIETTSVETTRYLMPVAAELVEAVALEKSFFYEEKIAEAVDIAASSEPDPSERTMFV